MDNSKSNPFILHLIFLIFTFMSPPPPSHTLSLTGITSFLSSLSFILSHATAFLISLFSLADTTILALSSLPIQLSITAVWGTD
jgi:hypothetical protein